MRLKFFFQLTIVCILFLNCKETKTDAETIPSYIPENTSQKRVVDLANLFSNVESDSLAYKIIGYEKHTTNQIAILTLDSLPPNTTIQYFGTEVGENWGIGTKEKKQRFTHHNF
ncbi:TPM domain-containing protein [Winogradskyella pacifica]|uniref:TPM domain-containing protein n=1 Tax=Winogradskyella pacifica TaxID=664642 RepID=UPI0015CC7953|nr:TPM domain-containing protein [Winogradskyella pacifica]